MPGPGGGSHSGGGHHGGSSSSRNSGGMRGNFGSAGARGHMHHAPRGHMYHGGWYRPRRYYGGGGCLSNITGIFLLPIILIIFIIMMFSASIGSFFTGLFYNDTNNIKYDENKFQDYVNTQYAVEFGSSTAYEDNILLTLLVDTNSYNEYYYIAWVGDHIKTDINYMFGNDSTLLGRTLIASINTTSYKYSLDSNIANAINTMTEQIMNKNLETSFNCNEEHIQVNSHLTNKTSLELTEETVNTALQNFTDKTGIPMVVLVDDITNVFSKQKSGSSIFGLIIIIVMIVGIIYFITHRRKNSNVS